MTTTTLRSSLSTQLPQTQNTAPVLEFRCLYTHDLKRKAKRWQDGVLKFHTFNRRVMVYDITRNFIGDTYIPSGGEVQEGDDLELEKDCALVQVADPIGKTQTDLTELLESRKKKDKPRLPESSRRTTHSLSSGVPVQKHRSLTALLGTPKGPHGKAVLPITSPYEERQKRKLCSEDSSSKRTRHSDSPFFSSSGAESGITNNAVTPSRPKASSRPRKANPESLAQPREVIDLCSDDKAIPAPTSDHQTTVAEASIQQRVDQRTSLATNVNHAKASSAHQASVRKKPPRENPHLHTSTTEPHTDQASGDESSKRQPLKVISNAPRKMLLCGQVPAKTKRKQSDNGLRHKTAPSAPQVPSVPAPDAYITPHQQRLNERLARLGQRKATKHFLASTPEDPLLLNPTNKGAPCRQSTRTTAITANQPVPAIDTDDFSGQIPAVHAQATQLPSDLVEQTSHRVAVPQVSQRDLLDDDTLQASYPIAGAADGDVNHLKKTRTSRLLPARVDQRALEQAGSASDPRTEAARDPADTPAKPSAAFSTIMRPPLKPPKLKESDPLDAGPWSREAFDLFDWWPPDRDKEGNRIPATVGMPV